MKLLSQDNRRKLLSWLAGCRTNFELGLLFVAQHWNQSGRTVRREMGRRGPGGGSPAY